MRYIRNFLYRIYCFKIKRYFHKFQTTFVVDDDEMYSSKILPFFYPELLKIDKGFTLSCGCGKRRMKIGKKMYSRKSLE